MADNSPRLRNARACEACRASKSRCVYKSQLGLCTRCGASGSECVVRSKARPMRTRTMRPGSTVGSNQTSVSTHSEFSLDLPTVVQPDANKDVVALHDHHKDFFGDAPGLRHSSEESALSRPSIVEQRRLGLKEAEVLLNTYRAKATSFPFVYIPPTATIPTLARNSPFVLLAILTSACINDLPLYHQLNHEYKRILSAKVIAEGKKSLDYLQGLLVYIAWYPHHVNPRNNQAFMYMNLAISLVTDLGMDQERAVVTNFNEIDTGGLFDGDDFSKAAKRAYLGCYYLSSSISQGFQTPNNILYQPLMNLHSEVLMLDEFSPEIYSLVKLRRLTEKIGEWHRAKVPETNSQMEALNAEVNIQICLNELIEWRSSTDDTIRNLPNIGMTERFTEMTVYSYQLGFLNRPYREHIKSTVPTQHSNPAHLQASLTACKKFFEYVLSLPDSIYHQFTVVQWGELVQTHVVLSRLTFLMAAVLGWDSNTTKANIPFGMYLDALCYRFQAISSTTSDSKNPDVLHIFKIILGSVKKSYERRVNNLKPPEDLYIEQGIATGYCPMMDPKMDMFFGAPDSSYGSGTSFETEGMATPGFGGVPGVGVPLYHDLWATMTGSWAEE